MSCCRAGTGYAGGVGGARHYLMSSRDDSGCGLKEAMGEDDTSLTREGSLKSRLPHPPLEEPRWVTWTPLPFPSRPGLAQTPEQPLVCRGCEGSGRTRVLRQLCPRVGASEGWAEA